MLLFIFSIYLFFIFCLCSFSTSFRLMGYCLRYLCVLQCRYVCCDFKLLQLFLKYLFFFSLQCVFVIEMFVFTFFYSCCFFLIFYFVHLFVFIRDLFLLFKWHLYDIIHFSNLLIFFCFYCFVFVLFLINELLY